MGYLKLAKHLSNPALAETQAVLGKLQWLNSKTREESKQLAIDRYKKRFRWTGTLNPNIFHWLIKFKETKPLPCYDNSRVDIHWFNWLRFCNERKIHFSLPPDCHRNHGRIVARKYYLFPYKGISRRHFSLTRNDAEWVYMIWQYQWNIVEWETGRFGCD